MRKFFALIGLLSALYSLWSCADDDSFTLSTANRLTFSQDTIALDTVFSRVPSSTRSFWVYNKSGDGIRCMTVRLANGNQSGFRVNVDGEYLSPTYGYQTSNLEIRKGDSVRVFVELTSPVNGKQTPQLLEDELVFALESGVEQKVALNAWSWDATLLNNLKVSNDTVMDSPDKPVVIYGGITVDSLATLTVTAGTTLYFHGNAGIDVYGRLLTNGTGERNVVMRGDRTDRMFDYLPYDMVSGQWKGIRFHSSSYENSINYTDIHSTFDGVVCDSSDLSRVKLQLYNSTVHNCQGYGVKAENCVLDIRNSQISNALNDCVAIFGGAALLQHCTIAQFYPFDASRGAALRYTNFRDDVSLPLYQMDCINSIVTGYADDVVFGSSNDSTTVFMYKFVNSILRTPEIEASDYVVNVTWEDVSDTSTVSGYKNFKLVDIDQQRYDFHLDSVSLAIDRAEPTLSLPEDRDGLLRDERPDIGCYERRNEE
ncbi:MAG: right-handed parallel beta-helix repeat-containing protein [Bacteroidales bacterium]|nr:right-handed parallel beta-helix repeat-containing protein [Bacteroidales bacterium]